MSYSHSSSRIINFFRIIAEIFIALIAIFLLVFSSLNISKFVIYDDYYKASENLYKIPALKDGFVPQGICFEEEDNNNVNLNGTYVAGYMKNGETSRIYRIWFDSYKDCYFEKYVKLTKNGEPFTGKIGGICFPYGRMGDLFISDCDSHVYVIPYNSTFRNFDYGSSYVPDDFVTYDIGDGIEVDNHADFISCFGNYLYVGEFHREGTDYICDTEVQIDSETTNHATLISYYIHDYNILTPTCVYSIPDSIQGAAVFYDGSIALSSSYGANDSHIYYYEQPEEGYPLLDIESTKLPTNNIRHLGKPTLDIKAPAMVEGIARTSGKGIAMINESASNKYIFGKFFFADNIVTLDLWKLLQSKEEVTE